MTECQGNKTYKAKYSETYIDYTIKFVNYDNTVISSKTYHYGDDVEVPANPTRPSDATNVYTFAGWDSEVTECQGNKTYRATYTSTTAQYTIVFVDYNGTVLSAETYNRGEVIIAPVYPSRESTLSHSYTFAGWDKPVSVTAVENATYTATYTETLIEYTIKFVDYDNTVISSEKYHYGDSVIIPSAPSREKEGNVVFVFTGWNKEITDVTGNATYVAQYESHTESNIGWIVAAGSGVSIGVVLLVILPKKKRPI